MWMNYIDLKYCSILSNKLEKFKVKSNTPYKSNFRCPICGDSQISKNKSRGWIVEKDNTAFFHCFNCGVSYSLRNFLKNIDVNLYNEYVIDTKIELPKPIKKVDDVSPTYIKNDFKKIGGILSSLKKVSQLSFDHPVKKYVIDRKIPTNQHYRLYYAPKFNKWVNTIIPNKLNPEKDEPRLVIPLFDENGHMFGLSGRSFNKSSLRYITIMIDESKPKLFGLDKVDFSKKYYIVEGPIDSLFLDNCIAMVGADGNSKGMSNPENAIYVFDNEPRNVDVVNRMSKVLNEGYKVCIWPSKIKSKDINDMILSGLTNADISLIIDVNSFEGLHGKLQLSQWRKC
jgi:transcription elongation factor Elf1